MHANYTNPVLKQLRDQQVRFAPRDQQLEQANRAENAVGRNRSRAGSIPTSISASALPISADFVRQYQAER